MTAEELERYRQELEELCKEKEFNRFELKGPRVKELLKSPKAKKNNNDKPIPALGKDSF